MVEAERIVDRSGDQLGTDRGSRPGVHHVGFALDLVGGIARRQVDRRIHWKRFRRCNKDAPLLAGPFGIPNRERYAEMALTRYRPVPFQALDPGFETLPHVVRMPDDLPALPENLGLEIQRLDEPLRRDNDLERRA